MQELQQGQNTHHGLLSDPMVIDECFEQLRRVVYREIDRKNNQFGQLALLKEYGTLPAKCRYFFIQPPGGIGKLFERSGRGWVVSFCERIRGQDLFIRRGEAIERVVLQVPEHALASPRVSSSTDGGSSMSFRLYIRNTVHELVNESL
ncbi:MAG: hypothetical protein AB8C84_06640 [Oligoflexales bacterium]